MTDPPRARERLRPRHWGLLLAVLVVAAALRASPAAHARDGDNWQFSDGDSLYHLHRVEQTIAAGGRVPMFDPRLSWPDGARVQWHGGYDLTLAALVVARCGVAPDRGCLETTAAWSTPVLGLLAVLATWWLALALAGPSAASIAAALFAVYPFSAGSAAFGLVDHHVLEPTLVACWLALLAYRRPVAAGLVAGLALAVFPSALFPIGMTTIALALDRAYVLGRVDTRDWTTTKFAASTWCVSVPVALTGAFPDRFEPAASSLFHVAALGAASAAAALIESVGRTRWRAVGVWLATSAVFVVALSGPLAALVRFGAVGGLWEGVVQQQSIANGAISALVLFAIVALATGAAFARGIETGRPALRWVSVVALGLGWAGIAQMRFLMAASPALVVVLAVALSSLHRLLKTRLVDAPRRTRALGAAVFVLVLAVLLSPLREYMTDGEAQPSVLRGGTRVLRRLGANAPTRTQQSILADWTWGHHILYLTPYATVASPFILSGADRANVDARRALLSEGSDALLACMRRRASRYLLLSSGTFDAAREARSLGLVPPRAPAATALLAPRIEGWERLRLADADGDARLYERVQGARLVGRAAPHASIQARVVVRLPRAAAVERVFAARADARGRYALRVAQASVDGDLQIEHSDRACAVEAALAAVRAGDDVAVRCPRTDAHD